LFDCPERGKRRRGRRKKKEPRSLCSISEAGKKSVAKSVRTCEERQNVKKGVITMTSKSLKKKNGKGPSGWERHISQRFDGPLRKVLMYLSGGVKTQEKGLGRGNGLEFQGKGLTMKKRPKFNPDIRKRCTRKNNNTAEKGKGKSACLNCKAKDLSKKPSMKKNRARKGRGRLLLIYSTRTRKKGWGESGIG